MLGVEENGKRKDLDQMHIYPAIDVKNGHCVRLGRNNVHSAEVFSFAPKEIAARYQEMNAKYIHIIDLDGAIMGHAVNEDIIRDIVDSVSIPVQVGGGIRTIQDIEHKLNLGVSRVILGTMAVNNPVFVKEAVGHFGADRILISVDVKDNMVTKDGWENISGYNAIRYGQKMKELGIRTIVYTDVQRNGVAERLNLVGAQELVELTGLEVIVSGGITSLKDLERLDDIHVDGAVVREAIYENRIDMQNAIELFEKN